MSTIIKNLSFHYRVKQVLDDISFNVAQHEIVAVLGPNGAGKSTLLKCINGILSVHKGTVLINEDDIRFLSRIQIAQKTGYVAQRNETARMTVFDAILLGRYAHLKYRTSKIDIHAVNAIITTLKMEALALRYIDQLSGGELQKVCIARALVQEPVLLLLDEPTTSLDLKNQVEILELIRIIADGHAVSAIMSLHDINMAIHYADRMIFLKDHRIYKICSKQEITEELIRNVYDIDVTLHYTDDYPIIIPVHGKIKSGV